MLENSDLTHLGAEFVDYYLQITALELDYFTTDPILLLLQADDGQGGVVSQTVSVFIDPVNDAPVMTDIDPQATDEEESLNITVSSSDVDTGTGADDENVPTYTAES